jgi:hypothetical protein
MITSFHFFYFANNIGFFFWFKTREADLLAIDVASTGRFIMTCTPKNELDILDLKGNLLASVITNQMETYSAKISPDGRFVATSGS